MKDPIEHDEEAEGLLNNQPKNQTPKQPLKKHSFGWIHSVAIVVVTLCILAGILIIAYQTSDHYAAQTEDIMKPTTDQREYQNFVLSNGMNVLLISDPQTTSSAASVSVQTGSFADPPSMKGLAHFVEHLLFLGSDKYPNVNTFPIFVSNNGGSYNAYTRSEETNFHFQTSSSSFESALDMFLHMFVDPIFTEEWANNEVAAVDGEYNIDLQKDGWRFQFALQLAANPRSPYSQFVIGNTQTLIEEPESEGLDITDTIQNFFDSYYSSNMMSLVVLHNETIDTMQSLVKQQFSVVDNKQIQQPSYSQFPKPFSDDYANNLIQILPVGTDRIAYLIFCVDSAEPYPEDDPLNYIYNLLSYGGQGGLSSIFKKKGWIVEFSANSQARQSSFELVRVALTLTEDGMDNLTEMVRMTLAYINLISKQGLTQALFDQFAKTSKYIFDYYQYEDESHDIMSEVKTISSNMNTYPIHYVLAGEDVLYNFNSELTARFLSQINVDNLVILVGDPSFETVAPRSYAVLLQDSPSTTTQTQTQSQTQTQEQTQTGASTQSQSQTSDVSDASNASSGSDDSATSDAPSTTSDSLLQFSPLNRYDDTYQLNYAINKFSNNFINSVSQVSYTNYPQLKLPVKSPYIPANFAIAGSSCVGAACIQQFATDRNNKVKQILSNANTIVRYLTERSFGAPFTTCYIKLNSANLQNDVKYKATSGIIAQLISLVHTEELYDVQAAGHSVDLSTRTIKVEAFSEKFPTVLQAILKQYIQTNYTQELFENARDNFASDISQNLLSKSYALAFDIQNQLLLGRSYTSLDIQQAASSLTFANFKTILQDMQTSAQIETFLYGNLLESQANTYGPQIVTLLGYQAYDTSKLITESVVNINGKNFVYREQTPTLKGSLSVTLNYYQGGVVNIKDLTNLKILTEILKPEASTYLRTQQKLGYIATLRDDLTRNVMGLKVLVVSSSFTPNQVDLEIENFWKVAADALNALTDDDIKSVIESYKEDQVYDTKSYRIKGSNLYSHISNEDYIFDMRERIVAYLPNVTKNDLLALFNAIVKQPKKISIQLYSQDQETVESALLPATSEYSNTAPTLIQGKQDLSSLPRFASQTVFPS